MVSGCDAKLTYLYVSGEINLIGCAFMHLKFLKELNAPF